MKTDFTSRPKAKELGCLLKDTLRTVSSGAGSSSIVLACMLSLPALCGCNETRPRTPGQIVHECQMLADSVSQLTSIPFQVLPTLVKRWTTLEDELYNIIDKDSLLSEEFCGSYNCFFIYRTRLLNSIKISITDQKHSFSDLLWTMDATSDSLSGSFLICMDEASRFYAELEDISLVNATPNEQENSYLSLLDAALSKDPASWDDFKEFLSQEDILFRSYMTNLSDHPIEASTEIVQKTETILRRMADLSYAQTKLSDTVLAYLTYRTNRRLVLSAEHNLQYILDCKTKTPETASLALSSVLAPFVTFSTVLTAGRTTSQRKSLERIGQLLPNAIHQIESQEIGLISQPDSLPNRIISEYYSYLIND